MSRGWSHRPDRSAVAPAVAPAAPDSDQQALPGALADFLRHPEVHVRSDERNCEVVISMPSFVARQLAHHHPDPEQVLLSAALIEAAEQDAEGYRREMQEIL